MMNYKKIAEDVIALVGGKDNVNSVAHCATRLRFVLNNESLANKEKLEGMEAVKGAFSSSGQYQIILGQGVVNKVYAEIVGDGAIKASSTSEATNEAMKNLNPAQRMARTLSNIFVPIWFAWGCATTIPSLESKNPYPSSYGLQLFMIFIK